jgi:hypothetical protein
MENGLCRGVEDATDYILNRLYVPIANDMLPYAMKYYHPIPDVVNSFDDFQGKWYADAQFTVEVPELNN